MSKKMTLELLSIVQRVANFHLYGCNATEPPHGRACSCGAWAKLRLEIVERLQAQEQSALPGLREAVRLLADCPIPYVSGMLNKRIAQLEHAAGQVGTTVAPSDRATASQESVRDTEPAPAAPDAAPQASSSTPPANVGRSEGPAESASIAVSKKLETAREQLASQRNLICLKMGQETGWIIDQTLSALATAIDAALRGSR